MKALVTAGGPTARRRARACVCLVVALASFGCISRTHAPYLGPPDPGAGSAWYASAEPRRIDLESIRVEPLARQSEVAHRAFSIDMPSVGHNGQEGDQVRATYYQGTAPGLKRLVVVLPIWGASTYPSRQVVRRLLANSSAARTDVLEIHGEGKLFDWSSVGSAASEDELLARLAATTASLSNSAADVGRLLDWTERRGDVDPERIGIVGLSIGAIVGILAMGRDDRLVAGAFVMGGANLDEVFGACRGLAGEARRLLCDRFGWDEETFRRKIEATVEPYNPVRVAGNIHPSRVLLVDAAFDHCMPKTARDELWEAMGRPERITLTYGHKVAFLSMTPLGFHVVTRRILDFLDERLGPG